MFTYFKSRNFYTFIQRQINLMCLYYVLHTLLGNINKKNNLHINRADIYGTYIVSALSQVPGLILNKINLFCVEEVSKGIGLGRKVECKGIMSLEWDHLPPWSRAEGCSSKRTALNGNSEKAKKMNLSSILTEEFWHQ